MHGNRTAQALVRVACIGVLQLIVPMTAGAGTANIHKGAVELHLNGAGATVEGSSIASVTLGAGYFWTSGQWPLQTAFNVRYSHVTDLDSADFEAVVAVHYRIDEGAWYPFVAAGAGIRQLWIGSFSQNTTPLSLEAGAKFLAGERVALAASYTYRRITGDPVADYNEFELRFGLAMYLRNKTEGNR